MSLALSDTKEKRTKATPDQLAFMIDYMKTHPGFAAGHCGTGLQGKLRLERIWLQLAKQLNSLLGPPKTVSKWKQTWRDLKSNMKKKGSHSVDYGADNDVLLVKSPLNDTKEQVVTIMGPVVYNNMDDDLSTESKPSTAPPTVLDPLLDSPDSHRIPSPPHRDQLSPIPSPSSPPVAASLNYPPRMHFRPHKRQNNFYSQLLHIKKQKLEVKKERNDIEKQKAAAINRLADVLQQIADKLN